MQDWIGRTRTDVDPLEPARSAALTTALGRPSREGGGAMPLLHHWLYFWDVKPPAEIGPDGHPARGGFMPPVALPRRMWAGSRLAFHAPIPFGRPLTRVSTILKIEEKQGKAGALVFVTVGHAYHTSEGLALSEEQDIVYRGEAPASAAPAPAAPEPDIAPASWRRDHPADEVLLFRYSALSVNGHRIHYDLPYATGVEGYPGLVVHGPLQATLMLDLATDFGGREVRSFSFRGLAPAFCGKPLTVCGEPDGEGAEVWVTQDGRRTMAGRVEWG